MKKVYKHYAIYKITNIKNGKIYIGMHRTNDLNDDYMGSGKRLRRSIQYHGVENFTKEILFDFNDEESMIEKEIELVNEEFIKRDDTYNLTLGGKGSWYRANTLKDFKMLSKKGNDKKRKLRKNPEHMSKITEKRNKTMRDTKLSDPEYVKWLSEKSSGDKNPFYGKKHSKNTIESISKKMSLKMKGHNNPSYGTMWITNGNQNKKIKSTELIPNGWKKGRNIN